MEVESAAPEAEQPVKQDPEEAEADEQPKMPNGVHAADEPAPEIDEPADEHEPESSAQTAVEVPEHPSEPAVESVQPEEEEQDDDAAPEAEAEPAKPVEEPSQPETESAPAAAVPREELPIWRKRSASDVLNLVPEHEAECQTALLTHLCQPDATRGVYC